MTNIRSFPNVILLCASVMLASCSDEQAEGDARFAVESDPAFKGALEEQIMTDQDLISQNRANNAATFGPQDGSLPTLDIGPSAMTTARAEAIDMLGGSSAMREAPEAKLVSEPLPVGVELSALVRAAASGEAGANCAGSAEFGAAWAAKMPEAFPVYPRAAVQEAAGSDAQNCRLRVVNFLTPVAMKDVVNFYYSSALAADYSAEHIEQGGDDIIGGVKGGASYVVYARTLAGGVTEVDLVTNGL